MRMVGDDTLLVDLRFIELVLMNWKIWEKRSCFTWQCVWERLCESASEQNQFRQANCDALLECELIQKAIRIPWVRKGSGERSKE